MLYKTLLKFIDKEDARLKALAGSGADERARSLGRTVQLTEELGELSNEILAFSNFQQQEKLARHDPQTLADKFTDLVISTLLLGKGLNINLKKALRDKVSRLNKRRFG